MTGNLRIARDRYRAGELDKHQYIDAMHALHASLFDYAEFMRGTEIGKIEICDSTVVVSSRAGVRFECDAVDHRQPPLEAMNFGRYESADGDMLLRLLQPDWTVFDIGANIGWYTLHIAKQFRDVRVYSFEPIPATYAKLRRNLELNGFDHVWLHNFGFSNRDGMVTFFFSPEGSGAASAANLSESPSVEELTCSVRRLDAFRSEFDVHPDAIKCDVEGAELLVFQGGLECLAHDRPLVFCEMLRKWSAKFGYHPNEIIALMGTIGYECFEVRGDRLARFPQMEENTEATNFFFLHQDRHRGLMEQLVNTA